MHRDHSSISVYFCGRECCEPGHSFGPAIRPHYLLHVVLDGKGCYQKDGVIYELKKGDAFLIPPMESCFYQADFQIPWSYAWVGFDGKACEEMLSKTVFSDSFVFCCPSPEHARTVSTCMENLLSAYYEARGSQLKPLGNLMILFSCMPHPAYSIKDDYSHQYFKKAQEYIENNYTYPIRVTDIARHVGIDRTYLYKIFMEQENISPKQYLLQHRIRIAAQMLCSSSYTITEIAFSCGFKDTPAFCNYFKKYIGHTPKNFRKLYKSE